MDALGLVIYGVAGFLAAIFSGIAGGGGGFVMTPLAIFLGLTPAQSVASGKFGGLSVTIGSLFGMRRERGRISKRRVIPVMVLAFVVGLLVPFVIVSLDSDIYKFVLGVILLLMVPLLLYKKIGLTPSRPTGRKKIIGGGLLTVAMALQGVFSGGLGSLVTIVLMGMLGMTAIEANMTKRWSQLILNVTIIAGVIGSSLVVWPVALVGIGSTFLGGYVGGKLAVKKGDGFVLKVMLVLIVISAIGLMVDALR